MPQKSIEQYERELMEMYRLALAKDPNYAALARRHSAATVQENISQEISVTIPAPGVEEVVPLPSGIMPMPHAEARTAAPSAEMPVAEGTGEAAASQATALPIEIAELPAVEVVLPVPARTPNSVIGTQAPIATPTAAPTETRTAAPTETRTAAPTETRTAAPTETRTEAPTETRTEVPTETRTEVPTETRTAAPDETETVVEIDSHTTPEIVPEVGLIIEAEPSTEVDTGTETGNERTAGAAAPSSPSPTPPPTSEEPRGMVATPNIGAGNLIVNVTTQSRTKPVVGAVVTVSHPDESGNTMVARAITDSSGKTELIRLPAPIREIPVYPQPMTGGDLSAKYIVTVQAPGFETVSGEEVSIFDGVTSVKRVDLTAEPGGRRTEGNAAESRSAAQGE